jgi:chemotaxis protein methyltransferase CheR
MTVMIEEDSCFKKILAFLLNSKGFDGNHYKTNYIKRRIAVRMRASGALTYAEYLKILENNQQESSRLLERLTIHVTEFFRDPGVYKSIQEKILPEIFKEPGKRARVWSAGCSTGEERILSEYVSSHRRTSFEILATDVDPKSINVAEKGEYSRDTLAKVPKVWTSRWLRSDGAKVIVALELKDHIRFRSHDLLGKWVPAFSEFDLIFCRNLFIYLTGSQQQRIYERFSKALRPEGYLVLGLTETLLGPARKYFQCVDVRHRIYQNLGSNHGLDLKKAADG